jgi:SRSO17 transposase
VGVFLAYSSPRGRGPLDRRLYLPEDWASDPARRKKTHVPPGTSFRTKWQMGLDLLAARRDEIRHGWITGDDEFGRAAGFREQLRAWNERYVLDVPCDTLVRDLQRRRPPRRRGRRGRRREVPFVPAKDWAAAQAPSRWQRFKIADGEKGPLLVDAVRCTVQTRTDGRVGAVATLLVTRSVGPTTEFSFALTNAGPQVPLEQLLSVKAQRHHIEELFEQAKGEAGLSHYEVRSWTGWHHHVTLSLLALWFLATQRRRLRGKKSGHHRATGSSHLRALAS